jgi:hypothetical protein
MAIAVGELYQVTLTGLYQGQTIENVLMFRARTTTATDAQIGGDLQTFWDLLRPLVQHDYTLTYMQVKRMTPVALDTFFVPAAAGHENGAATGGGVNSTIAAVITLRTGTAGKSHRGRIYLAPVDAGNCDTDGCRLSAGGLANYNTAFTNIKNLVDDATGTALYVALGIYSRLIGGQNPFTVAGWQAVSQFVTQPILGNQRRRRMGRGV